MKNEKKKNFESKLWKPIEHEDVILSKSVFNDSGFDKHIHEEFVIGVVSNGQMNGFIDGTTKSVNKKSIVTMNPDTAHSNWSLKHHSYSQSAVNIQPSYLTTLLKENFNSKQVYFKTGLLENETLSNEFISLMSEFENNELSTIDYECRLIEVINKILLANTCVREEGGLSKHDIAIMRAKEFMQDNLSLDITLDDISQEIDVSKYHFLRLFKKYTHFSPHVYLMFKRLEQAKKLLQQGKNIVDVVYSCGFSDQSHLNKHFKAYVGLTPKVYQNFFI